MSEFTIPSSLLDDIADANPVCTHAETGERTCPFCKASTFSYDSFDHKDACPWDLLRQAIRLSRQLGEYGERESQP